MCTARRHRRHDEVCPATASAIVVAPAKWSGFGEEWGGVLDGEVGMGSGLVFVKIPNWQTGSTSAAEQCQDRLLAVCVKMLDNGDEFGLQGGCRFFGEWRKEVAKLDLQPRRHL